MTESTAENWYVIKRPGGHCEIVSKLDAETYPDIIEQWGPFTSQGDAITRRIGLIRAGKCQPQ